VEIDLKYVPQRETGMTPYEIMLSESQERMLLVAEKGREQEVFAIFHKWGLDATTIGQVTGDGMLRVRDHGKVVAEIPCNALAKDCPMYERPSEPPQRIERPLYEFVAEGTDLTENFLRLLGSPSIASKRYVYEQYDHMVRTNTVVGPGAGDAAVLRLKGTKRGLALSLDGNGRYCRLEPKRGAQLAVAEACRNVVSTGARPLAATNCLNFGNPEKPAIMGQFRAVIDGMAEACRTLGTPVTGGNVSFYNETLGQPIYPTPVIGILGVMEDISRATGMGFRESGDWIVLLEANGREARGPMEGERRRFSSSEYAKVIAGITAGEPPEIDLEAERKLYEAVLKILARGLACSAHDVSDGGIAVTVAESCFASPVGDLGAEITLDGDAAAEYALFEESPSRIVISTPENHLAEVLSVAAEYGVSSRAVGKTIPAHFIVRRNGRVIISSEVSRLRAEWSTALERLLQFR
jgi:phosphoribosylformylglycinamidine synthase